MQLELKQPVQTLNSSYRRANLGLAQATTFKNNLSKLLEGINNTESEENQKNIVIEFLKNTYYKDLHEVNTKGRQDLVIHNDKTAKSSVGVIIEVKRTSNKAEMISAENPNAKALQELLHYYLKERFISNNKEIKHLIITNIYEWYVFDGADFERFFFENKQLKEDYKNWTEGKLGINTTDWFYKEIAKPFLEDKTLECTYFDIRKLKDVVSSDLPLEREQEMLLVDTYKTFSPEHLLKKTFQNDANTLNTAFYNEFLHILGVEETGTNKKIITRIANPKDRNEGSLLENTISNLTTNQFYLQYPDKEQFGETQDEQIFSFALELCITWLNRILFLKLLEGQLLKYHQKDTKYKFLYISKIKSFSELDKLFFQILAIPIAERTGAIAEKFANIPYLNSSLFDKIELEKVLQINLLVPDIEIPIFNTTVLKDDKGKRIAGNNNTLKYLFEFLDAFDFASDVNVRIQQSNKTIINASVLGLIFEKINGYKDGSIFTPSFITMYMCRETIFKAVIQKFNDQYNWNCTDFIELYDKMDTITKKQANDTINKLKICDPAVGSGHFLVSALNEIIVIKHQLKILIDKEGKRLRDYDITIENDELVITDTEDNKNFLYNFNNTESQKVQETLFNEKQIIIENCLFGVDINPKSVLICRLRLWIELLKNMYYTQESKFKELETLPNIDINIKTGNSLIGKFNLDDKMNDFAPAARQYIKKIMPDYKIQVDLYKSVRDKATKNIIIKKITDYKNNFSKMFNPKDKDLRAWKEKENEWLMSVNNAFLEDELTNKLLEENNALKAIYEDKMAIYRNAFEWRFEFPEVLNDDGDFVGFDLIVGNPPYISNKEIKLKEKEIYKKFVTGKEQYDLYSLFIEQAINITAKNGINTFIIPDSLLGRSTFKETRKFLKEQTQLYKINHLDQVFDDISVSSCIYFLNKKVTSESLPIYFEKCKNIADFKIGKVEVKNINYLTDELINSYRLLFIDSIDLSILRKFFKNTPLGNMVESWRGEEIGKKSLKITTTSSDATLPILTGENIDRYAFKKQASYIEIDAVEKDLKKYQQEKILVRQVGAKIFALLDINNSITVQSVYNLYSIKPEFSNKTLLALLNSSLFHYVYVSIYAEKQQFPRILLENIRMLCIPTISPIANLEIADLVDAIITQKAAGLGSLENERKIDALVYDLYEITEEEQKIIEGK